MAFKDNFRGDSAYTQIMTKIFNIFWLSILWLLCCIPVLTIGASTIALYYVLLKLVKDEETTVTREFFHSFKQNFLQSLPVTVIVLVVVVVLVAEGHRELLLCTASVLFSGLSAQQSFPMYFRFLQSLRIR